MKVRLAQLLMIVTMIVTGGGLYAQGLYEQTELFVAGQDNYNAYRIPAVICTKSGTVLAFSEGRKDYAWDGGPTDVVLKRSLGNEGKWTPAFATSRGLGHQRRTTMMWLPLQVVFRSTPKGEAWMNPVPVVDQKDGTIYLFANYFPQPYKDENAPIWMTRSTDEGATWSAPVEVTQTTGRHEIGPGVGIQTRSGRLIVQVYDGIIYSDDHGKSWKAGGVAPGEWNETQVVELVDGTLLFSRRGMRSRRILFSKDQGETWSQPVIDHDLPDPDCQGSMIRYTREDMGSSKNRILFSNPLSGNLGVGSEGSDPRGRFNVTVRLSYDEGKSWPVAKRIQTGPGAYSSMTVFPDGSIGILYETGSAFVAFDDYSQKIVFARFTLDWLTDGKDYLDDGK